MSLELGSEGGKEGST
uniref:Uncharacterized protein n=1 Tax=Anguilla anguilla TaxID=7936 RepID=A0A0E9Q4Y3_ANGAN